MQTEHIDIVTVSFSFFSFSFAKISSTYGEGFLFFLFSFFTNYVTSAEELQTVIQKFKMSDFSAQKPFYRLRQDAYTTHSLNRARNFLNNHVCTNAIQRYRISGSTTGHTYENTHTHTDTDTCVFSVQKFGEHCLPPVFPRNENRVEIASGLRVIDGSGKIFTSKRTRLQPLTL